MGQVTALRLADSQTGWVGGKGWIAKSMNAGKSWTKQYVGSGTIHQIFALNKQLAWASVKEDSSLLMTQDGGDHWSWIGKTPNNGFIHFVTKAEGYSANAQTLDGGMTWRNGQQRFDGLDAELLAMASFKQGWLIVTDSVKPSVLYTTEDGAIHWKKAYTFAKP